MEPVSSETLRLGAQDSGPHEDDLGYVLIAELGKLDVLIIYYGNNELKLYIMVGTTIQAALAKGTIVCMLFSLPSVYHCL